MPLVNIIFRFMYKNDTIFKKIEIERKFCSEIISIIIILPILMILNQ